MAEQYPTNVSEAAYTRLSAAEGAEAATPIFVCFDSSGI
jgi:hypothetical protein